MVFGVLELSESIFFQKCMRGMLEGGQRLRCSVAETKELKITTTSQYDRIFRRLPFDLQFDKHLKIPLYLSELRSTKREFTENVDVANIFL